MRAVRKFAGVEQRYESLTVRDVIAAIEAKHWPDDRDVEYPAALGNDRA
jgi:hypothetical protein